MFLEGSEGEELLGALSVSGGQGAGPIAAVSPLVVTAFLPVILMSSNRVHHGNERKAA